MPSTKEAISRQPSAVSRASKSADHQAEPVPGSQQAISYQLSAISRTGDTFGHSVEPVSGAVGAGGHKIGRAAVAVCALAVGVAFCGLARAQIVVPATAEPPAERHGLVPIDGAGLRPVVPQSPTLSAEPLELREETRTWYGWQNFFVMAGSLGMALLFDETLIAGAIGFYLGPPIIHAIHGNSGKGLTSLCVGAGGAVAVGAASTAIAVAAAGRSDGSDEGLPWTGFVVGASVAGLAYAIVDVAVLSWKEPRTGAKARAESSPLNVAPRVWFARNQTTFGFSGEF